MADDNNQRPHNGKRIVVVKDGPYIVEGDLPLVTKTQVVSEHGEPLTWKKGAPLTVSEGEYHLCRCGQTANWPFCDGAHRREGFDGTETADTGLTAKRAMRMPFGTRITVRKDPALCMQSGFCGFSDASLGQVLAGSRDTKLRALVTAMVERCPSGALTYTIEADGAEIEPDLPEQVALTIEITSAGPIAGPLWVTGGIPVERADGQPLETRNRVTLCNCGESRCKPLCDGTHRDPAQQAARRRRAAGR